MFKRNVSIFTAVIFISLLFSFVPTKNAYAYQNNSYFTDVKVGLASMSSSTLKLTLNGDYSLNGQTYPSGSTFNLGISGTSIILNGSIQSQIALIPSTKSNLLTITAGNTSNMYMGSFLIKVSNGMLLPINTIDIESYLKGVVGYEMSDNFPLEALKAQTVAARNYALSRLGWEIAKGYDFDDTPGYQVYKGYNPSYTNVINAVDQTRGQVLLYNDKLVETLYSAWHGGVSEDSENVWGNYVPYLRSVVDTYESDPWPNGNKVLTNAYIQATLISKGYLASTDSFIKLDLNSITKFPSGRIANINIIYKTANGSILTKSVAKDTTRTFLTLPSNLYTVSYDSVNGTYTFSGKGNGHGLGMSQIGARNRAAAGQAYDTILKFYYQNVYIQNLIAKATLGTLNQSTTFLFTGNPVSFSATGTGGNGYGYLYKYVVKNGTNIVLTKDYSSSASLDFVPSSAGNYTLETYVKDSYSISDYDDKKISNFTVYDAPSLVSFVLDKSETIINQSLTANSDVQSGSGSYFYKYEVTKDGLLVATRDFSNDKAYTFSPSIAGNYVMNVYVKDSISTKAYDLKQSLNFSAVNPLTITSLSKDVTNVFTSDTVNLTAKTTGGSSNGSTYKFVVSKDNSIITTQDFSTTNTLMYVPNLAGSYSVALYVRDNLSQNTYDDVKTLSFIVLYPAKLSTTTTNKPQYITGQTINLNTSATLGSGSYLYKYVASKDGVILSTADYSSASNWLYPVTNSGTYNLTTYMKDGLSSKLYDDTTSLLIPVYDQPSMTFTGSKNAALISTSVNYNISEIGGSSVAQYRFVVLKDSIVIQDSGYSATNTFTFTPTVAGAYQVVGYLKDALSENSFDSKSTLTLNVYNPQLSAVTATGTFYEVKPIVFNTVNTGSSTSGFIYRYEIYSNSTLVTSSNYSSSNALSFTPQASGVYTVKVFGKDGLSTNAFDSTKQFSITIAKKPLYLSTLPISYGLTSSDVTALQTALIKLGYAVSSATGYFGTQTKSAVIVFQNNYGLTGDGVVGNMTYNTLNDVLIQKDGIKNLTF